MNCIEGIVDFMVAKLIVEELEPILKYQLPISKKIERLLKPRNPKQFRMRQIKKECKL
jgi:hypothetical protein